MAARPRLSILSLFDPLSSSSDSPDSDKENDCGDSSFFHPYGLPKQCFSPVRRLRRRLIDVGDMTVEEPNIRDLIEEELEAEISQTVTLEEDENATLTFRDMAKAATPKWSGKHAGRKGTPSTPRTPLAEIATRDEITPVCRKKIFKRSSARSIPAVSPLNVVHTEDLPTLVIHDPDNMSGNPLFAIFEPRTAIFGGDDETTKKSTSPISMGASTATLELPTPTGTLISDTPIPLFVSSSSEPNHTSRTPSPFTGSRLRPNAHMSESSNRHSVDLHASFQMHLSSSETTFDLLNDRISFLSSKNGLESFLDHEGASFGDDEVFGAINHELSSEMVSNEQRMGYSESELNLDLSITTSEVNEPALRDIRDQHASFHGRNGMPASPAGKNSYPMETVESVPDASPCKGESGLLSTANPSHPLRHPPRPVPALRIVKRIKASEQGKAAERNRRDSRNPSRGKTSRASASRAPEHISLGEASLVLTGNGIKNGRQAKVMSKSAPSRARDDQPAGGPRRVLATEVTKVPDIACTKARPVTVQAKSASGIDGPRRVQASDAIKKVRAEADLPMRKGEQPASVGSAVSGIPKPVTSRNLGSRIPAPPSKKLGLQIERGKGFLGRVAGK